MVRNYICLYIPEGYKETNKSWLFKEDGVECGTRWEWDFSMCTFFTYCWFLNIWPIPIFFKFLNIWPIPKIFNFQKIFLLNRGHLFSDFLKDMCKKYIKARNKDKLIGLIFLIYEMWCLRYLFVSKPCLCHLIVQKDTPAHHSRIAGQRLVERLAWLPCLLPSYSLHCLKLQDRMAVGCCETEFMTQNIHSSIHLPLVLLIVLPSQRFCSVKGLAF